MHVADIAITIVTIRRFDNAKTNPRICFVLPIASTSPTLGSRFGILVTIESIHLSSYGVVIRLGDIFNYPQLAIFIHLIKF